MTLRNTELDIVDFSCNAECLIRQSELNISESYYHAIKMELLKTQKSVSSKCNHHLIQIEFNMWLYKKNYPHTFVTMLCECSHYHN